MTAFDRNTAGLMGLLSAGADPVACEFLWFFYPSATHRAIQIRVGRKQLRLRVDLFLRRPLSLWSGARYLQARLRSLITAPRDPVDPPRHRCADRGDAQVVERWFGGA